MLTCRVSVFTKKKKKHAAVTPSPPSLIIYGFRKKRFVINYMSIKALMTLFILYH